MTNSPNLSRKKTTGQVMAAVGFLMILLNALDYLFGLDGNLIPLLIIGLVLVVNGMSFSANR